MQNKQITLFFCARYSRAAPFVRSNAIGRDRAKFFFANATCEQIRPFADLVLRSRLCWITWTETVRGVLCIAGVSEE